MKRLVVTCLLLGACQPNDTKAKEDAATLSVKNLLTAEIDALCSAAKGLQDAAPLVAWSSATHASDVAKMKSEWKKARVSYERIEGAIAVAFGDLDFTMDARYEDYVETEADTNLFDSEGVTGMHGIERILWSDEIPAAVVEFESSLEHYSAAAFPATAEEALGFKNELVGRLVSDCEKMETEFKPLALDAATAFRGVIGSMGEQHEKVLLADTAQEESRYARHTLGDMRANLDGGRKIYQAFADWLVSTENGAAIGADIMAGFDRVEAHYDAISGDAIPAVPASFNPDQPSSANPSDPYVVLFNALTEETDVESSTSLVSTMGTAADALGIPQLAE